MGKLFSRNISIYKKCKKWFFVWLCIRCIFSNILQQEHYFYRLYCFLWAYQAAKSKEMKEKEGVSSQILKIGINSISYHNIFKTYIFILFPFKNVDSFFSFNLPDNKIWGKSFAAGLGIFFWLLFMMTCRYLR